jgi:DNA-directed RNA polymerase specialized sigma subunit
VSISKIRKDSKYVFTNSLPETAHTEDTDRTEQDMNLRKLLDVIRHLNETDRSIILLYLEELSYKEIADIIGISVSNVSVKIHRLIKDSVIDVSDIRVMRESFQIYRLIVTVNRKIMPIFARLNFNNKNYDNFWE